MNSRKHKTAFTIAKIIEVLSFIVIIAGLMTGIAIGEKTNIPGLGFAIALFSIVFGLILIFNAQMILIIIENENNTRKIANENQKTNTMLSETLGLISKNLEKIADKKN